MYKIEIRDKKGKPMADSDIFKLSKPIKTAIARTINKVSQSAIVAAKREIRQKYTIPYKTLGQNIYIDKKAFVNRDRLFAVIQAFGRPLSISDFKYTIQNKAMYNISTRNKHSQQQVTVEVIKGQKKIIPKAFQLRNKDTIVLRTDAGLKTLKGISASGAFNQVQQIVIPASIQEKWGRVFTHELEYAMKNDRGVI